MKLTLLADEAVETDSDLDSELLQRLAEEGTSSYQLPKLAGGASLLRSVLAQLAVLADGSEGLQLLEPPVSPSSLGDYLEVAAVLRCPRLLRLLPVGQELRSRQALGLLEQVVRLSGEASETMDEAFAEVTRFFCASLDHRDLRLGDALAQGSLRVSLEVLRAHRQRQETNSPGGDARPGTATPSVTSHVHERSLPTIEWSEHRFALHVLQKQLEAEVAAGHVREPLPQPPDVLGMESEEEPEVAVDTIEDNISDIAQLVSLDPEEDISEDLAEVADVSLRRLAGLAEFLDTAATLPVAGAVAVRALLLQEDEAGARRLFKDLFHRSKKLRWMVVSGEVPGDFLREVAWHPAASVTLRRMLAGYQSGAERTCQLIEELLFGELLDEAHSQLILKHPLTEKLVLWLGGQGARAQQVAEELFQVSFIPQRGFLPEDGSSSWDDGSLSSDLLSKVPLAEDSLSLVRAVLLRLLRRGKTEGVGFVSEIARLWPLGRWKQCRDPKMIAEAFSFLSGSWKSLAALPGLGDLQGDRNKECQMDRRKAEELLLQMFCDLEVWRLPAAQLLTPWVPGQVLAAHVTAQCKELEDRQLSLVDETRENLEELSRLTAVVAQLKQRLEATDLRSTQCMQKQAEVNNTLRQLQ